jgi:membrane-associated phospholipid phosphatase
MAGKCRRQEIAVSLAIVLFTASAYGQTTASGQADRPDFSPSSVITAGAPGFHLRADPLLGGRLPSYGYPDSGESGREGFATKAVERGLEDQKQVWTALFHGAHLKWDALFLAGTATLVVLDEQIQHALPTSPVSTSATISNALIAGEGAALGGLLVIDGLHEGDTHAKEAGMLGIESLANAFLVYVPMQLVAGRQRPNEGTGEGNFFFNHSLNTSFPGGHAMFSFTMATVIAHEYPRWWVQLLSYGAASAITGARMTAKMHFPSDLLVGGAIGYLIGTHIFHAHCNPDLGGDCHLVDKAGP